MFEHLSRLWAGILFVTASICYGQNGIPYNVAPPLPTRHFLQLDQVLSWGNVVTEHQTHYFGGIFQEYLDGNNPDLVGRMHDTVAPFGASGVIPLARGKLELYGSMAGLFVPFQFRPNIIRDSWLTQSSLGVRVALDPGHHIWVGTTGYYLIDLADKTRQWSYGTADLTIRFGR